MDIINIRAKVKQLLETKKIKRTDIARHTGLGYITIINILKDDYTFEVKASTLRKIDKYLNAIS